MGLLHTGGTRNFSLYIRLGSGVYNVFNRVHDHTIFFLQADHKTASVIEHFSKMHLRERGGTVCVPKIFIHSFMEADLGVTYVLHPASLYFFNGLE